MSDFVYLNDDLDDYLNNMEYYYLPLFYYPNYRYNINVLDKNYIFEYKWNNAGEFWSLVIYDQNEVQLCSVKIVYSQDLLSNYYYIKELPQSIMISFNVFNSRELPDQFNISDNHKLAFTNIEFV